MGCKSRTRCAHALPHEKNDICDWITRTKKGHYMLLDCEEVDIEENDMPELATV